MFNIKHKTVCLVLGLTAVALGGCAPAASTAYQNHITTVVPTGAAMNNDVAMAFHLDEYSHDPAMYASAVEEPAGKTAEQ